MNLVVRGTDGTDDDLSPGEKGWGACFLLAAAAAAAARAKRSFISHPPPFAYPGSLRTHPLEDNLHGERQKIKIRVGWSQRGKATKAGRPTSICRIDPEQPANPLRTLAIH